MEALAFLACMAAMCLPVAACWWHFQQAARRSIPAAPDNEPGTDRGLLQTCQDIDRQTTAREEKP